MSGRKKGERDRGSKEIEKKDRGGRKRTRQG